MCICKSLFVAQIKVPRGTFICATNRNLQICTQIGFWPYCNVFCVFIIKNHFLDKTNTHITDEKEINLRRDGKPSFVYLCICVLLCPDMIIIVWSIFLYGFDHNSFLLRVVLIPKSNIIRKIRWILADATPDQRNTQKHTHHTSITTSSMLFLSLFCLQPFSTQEIWQGST